MLPPENLISDDFIKMITQIVHKYSLLYGDLKTIKELKNLTSQFKHELDYKLSEYSQVLKKIDETYIINKKNMKNGTTKRFKKQKENTK